MPLLTQSSSFSISPFGEMSACDELNLFLRSRRIVNVEKRLIDGERGTGCDPSFSAVSVTVNP